MSSETRLIRADVGRWTDRVARLLTEVLAPAVIAGVMPVIVAANATGSLAGTVRWGGAALLLTAILPYSVIWFGVRRGRLTDHHVGVRQQRRVPIVVGLASVLTGVGVLIVLGAPRPVIAFTVVLLGVIVTVGAVNVWWWKASAHAAVVAASSVTLIQVIGLQALPTALLVFAVAWSRVRLGDHTRAQVVVGAVMGAVVATSVLTPLAL